MKLEKIKELLREVDASGVSEFEVQEGDVRLVIRKGGHLGGTVQAEKAPVRDDSREVPAAEPEVSIQDGTIIRSPLVGIFHASVKDGEEALVTVGTKVEQGQVMGAIEAMKMMNDVAAACDGVVSEILVRDGDLVEYAQPLFVIEG